MFATTRMTVIAATLAVAGAAAGPLTAQTDDVLRPIDMTDTSAEMQADFDYNLSLLDVRLSPGETLTNEDIEEIKRIMNDESNVTLKSSRIQSIVAGDDGFGITTDIDN